MSELSTSAQRGPVWPEVWRDYFRFIRHPRLSETREPLGRAAFADVGWLVALILVMAALVGFLLLAVLSAMFAMTANIAR